MGRQRQTRVAPAWPGWRSKAVLHMGPHASTATTRNDRGDPVRQTLRNLFCSKPTPASGRPAPLLQGTRRPAAGLHPLTAVNWMLSDSSVAM